MAYTAKRKHKRGVWREGIKILTRQGIEYATFEDLSAGGVKLRLDHEMTPGHMMELEFSLGSVVGAKQKALATVVRCDQLAPSAFEIGVRFLGLDDASRERIEKLFQNEEGPF